MIRKSIYDLCYSSDRFHSHLADTLCLFVYFRLVSIMTFVLDLTNMKTTTNISTHMLMTIFFAQIMRIEL